MIRRITFTFFASCAFAVDEVPCVRELMLPMSNGVDFPMISFGTAGLPRGRDHEAVIAGALAAGFRGFDTVSGSSLWTVAAPPSTVHSLDYALAAPP